MVVKNPAFVLGVIFVGMHYACFEIQKNPAFVPNQKAAISVGPFKVENPTFKEEEEAKKS